MQGLKRSMGRLPYCLHLDSQGHTQNASPLTEHSEFYTFMHYMILSLVSRVNSCLPSSVRPRVCDVTSVRHVKPPACMALTSMAVAGAFTSLLALPFEREAQYGFNWDPEVLEHGERKP